MSPIPHTGLYKPIVERIAKKARRYGEGLQPPCSREAIADLRRRARERLGLDFPASYEVFLEMHNGSDWNGLVIYACGSVPIVGHEDRFIEDVVESNLDFQSNIRMKRLLVLGDSDMYLLICEPSGREYSLIDRVSLDRHEAFASFEEMLAATLRSHE